MKNRRHTSKGIIIELTALLDVILIMLFWVMLNMQGESKEIKADTDARINALEQKLGAVKSEADREVEKAWDMANHINSEAAANQKALYEYEQGLLITLTLRYDEGAVLYIKNRERDIGSVNLSSAVNLAEEIADVLKKAEVSEDEVVLCAFIYDGNVALYRDVSVVREAMEQVSVLYAKCYCTNINMAF